MSYQTMYENVLNRAKQSGTWANDRVKNYLNKGQGVLWRKAKEWKVLEKQATLSAVVGQENYAIPADFERPLHIQVELNGNIYELNELSYDTVRAGLNTYTANGRPTAYCIHYEQLYFNRKADATYTVRMDYIYQPSDMSATSDTSPFPEFILEEYAYAFLMRDLGHDKKFADAYNHFNSMLEEYADSDGRGEGLHGFNDGIMGHTHYWDGTRMWGGTHRKWYDR